MASIYCGWEKGKTQEIGIDIQKPSILAPPSFSPKNQPRIQPTTNPQQTMLAKRFEGDSLYDLQKDLLETPLMQSRKRSATSSGCMVSFTNVRVHEDEGDLAPQNNCTNVEGPPPKREKIVATIERQSKASKFPVMALQNSWKQVREDRGSKQDRRGSQSSTRPNSGNPSKNRACSGRNPNFKVPFLNDKTTQPSFRRAKGAISASTPDSPVSYQGFTATADAVSLSKTTLEKLSLFKYKPSTGVTVPRSPISVLPLIDFDLAPLIGNQQDDLMPHVSGGRYGSDEFDEGIADQDFLAIVPDVVITQTSSKLQLVHDDNFGRYQEQCIVPCSPVQAELMPIFNAHNGSSNCINSFKNAVPTPQILRLEPDDEYSIDEDDIEEMLKSPAIYQSIVEKFLPFASVQGLIHNDNDLDTEDYDRRLLFSPPTSPAKLIVEYDTDNPRASKSPRMQATVDTSPVVEGEDWSFMCANDDPQGHVGQNMSEIFAERISPVIQRQVIEITSSPPVTADSARSILDDSHEYEPLKPFVRPAFANRIMDRCPVIGLSSQSFLMTCFRIGEMFQVGAKCQALELDPVIELFARVNYSVREPGTTKQHFQFLDMWVDRPPNPNGILASFKTTCLVETESKVFIECNEKKMARVIGRLKKDRNKRDSPWLLDIINIRETDWEEIRWTRRIVSGDDLVKKGKGSSNVEVMSEV